MSQRVYSLFQKSVEAKMQVGEELAPRIDEAANRLVDCLIHEGKIMVCGNGYSSALAQIFTAALIDRYEKERPSLPAIWLGANLPTYTSIAADSSFSEVYSKPINAIAKEGDFLVVISSSGNSSSLIQAVSAAHARGSCVIALTGRDGGDISSLLDVNDVELCVPINSRGRIHEVHMLIINCLCDLIDHKLFGID